VYAALFVLTLNLVKWAEPQNFVEWLFCSIYLGFFFLAAVLSFAEKKVLDAAARKPKRVSFTVEQFLSEVPEELREQCRGELLALIHKGVNEVPKIHSLQARRDGDSKYDQYIAAGDRADQENFRRFMEDLLALADRYILKK